MFYKCTFIAIGDIAKDSKFKCLIFNNKRANNNTELFNSKYFTYLFDGKTNSKHDKMFGNIFLEIRKK